MTVCFPEPNSDTAYPATNSNTQSDYHHRGRSRGRRGFGGRNYHGVRRGGVEYQRGDRGGANLEAAQKVWECIFCQLDSHKTIDCRKLGRSRELLQNQYQQQDQRSLMMNYKPIPPGSWMVSGIGGSSLPVHGKGDILIVTEVNKSTAQHETQNLI